MLKNAKFNKQKSQALKLEIWRNQFQRSHRKERNWFHVEITEAYNSSGTAICCHVANFARRLFMDWEGKGGLGEMYTASSKLCEKRNKQNWNTSRQKNVTKRNRLLLSKVWTNTHCEKREILIYLLTVSQTLPQAHRHHSDIRHEDI